VGLETQATNSWHGYSLGELVRLKITQGVGVIAAYPSRSWHFLAGTWKSLRAIRWKRNGSSMIKAGKTAMCCGLDI
jgi:hypothetical protein